MELSACSRNYGNILPIFNPHYNPVKWIDTIIVPVNDEENKA